MAEVGQEEIQQETPAPNVDAEQSEKTLRQSEVNELVGRIKRETADKVRKEMMREMQNVSQPQQTQPDQMANQFQPGQSMGGMPQQQLSQNQVQQVVDQMMAQQAHAQFAQKMEQGKAKYPDFDEKVAQLNLPSIPHIVHWANGLDNTADIMYDIANNPEKFSNILTLSAVSPQMAVSKLKSLSDSIKSNESAQKTPSPPEPLDQLKPSTIGMDSGSNPTVRDFKKRYKG